MIHVIQRFKFAVGDNINGFVCDLVLVESINWSAVVNTENSIHGSLNKA